MNIEGAEYEIIKSMYGTSCMEIIKKAYIQWHWDKIGIPEAEHNRISSMIKWHPWNAMRPGRFVNQFRASI